MGQFVRLQDVLCTCKKARAACCPALFRTRHRYCDSSEDSTAGKRRIPPWIMAFGEMMPPCPPAEERKRSTAWPMWQQVQRQVDNRGGAFKKVALGLYHVSERSLLHTETPGPSRSASATQTGRKGSPEPPSSTA